MRDNYVRQVFLGAAAALLSTLLVLGSLMVAFTEGGGRIALVATATFTPVPTLSETITFSPSPTPTSSPQGTLAGEGSILPPTLTPSETVLASATATPSATLPPTPKTCPPPAGWLPVVVQLGDTLKSLAQAYNTQPAQVLQANCIVSEELLPGTILYLPPKPVQTVIQCGPPPGWIFYTVQAGDNLYRISLAFGVTVAQLQFANCLDGSTLIRVGQRLYVPNIPTRTWTPSVTYSPPLASTPTPTPSSVPSVTPTLSPEPSFTPTSTSPSPILTATATETGVPSETPTPTPSETQTEVSYPSPTPTPSPTDTMTPMPTETPTLTAEATAYPGP